MKNERIKTDAHAFGQKRLQFLQIIFFLPCKHMPPYRPWIDNTPSRILYVFSFYTLIPARYYINHNGLISSKRLNFVILQKKLLKTLNIVDNIFKI